MTNRRTALSRWIDSETGEFLDPGRHLDIVSNGWRYGASQNGNSTFDGRSGGHGLRLVRLDQH